MDTGIVDEEPVRYFVTRLAGEGEWQAASSWPPSRASVPFYLSAGDSDGGALSPGPSDEEGGIERVTDPKATSGSHTRWSSALATVAYESMNTNDARSIVFTSAPFEHASEIVGHPVVTLWIETDAPDLDLFAYLEEVDPAGTSHYLTEGQLRASRRHTTPPPYRNLGLPYHPHRKADVKTLEPGRPALLEFDLLPIAHRVAPGHRLRLAIAGSDAESFISKTPPGTRFEIRTGGRSPSTLRLPLREVAP
jgi:putative CocE/NonD family hydrolase